MKEDGADDSLPPDRFEMPLMSLLAPLLQVMPPPKMPPIPWWLVAFAIFALTFAGIWMLVLVLHAAREERQARAQEQGLKR